MSALLSPSAAGKMVGVTGKTVKNWIRSGIIPADSWLKSPTGRYKVDSDAVMMAVSGGDRSLCYATVPEVKRGHV